MTVLGRWWNGIWGRLGRRDIWLSVNYRVTARQGDSETGKVLRWDFGSEAEARAMVERLKTAPGAGKWRDRDPEQTTPAPSTEVSPGS